MSMHELKSKVLAHVDRDYVRQFGNLSYKATWQAAYESLSEAVALAVDEMAAANDTDLEEMAAAPIGPVSPLTPAEVTELVEETTQPELGPLTPALFLILAAVSIAWCFSKAAAVIGAVAISGVYVLATSHKQRAMRQALALRAKLA